MFRNFLRPSLLLALLAGLLISGVAGMAHAQPAVGVGKALCVGEPTSASISSCLTGTPVGTVQPYQGVFYVIDLNNTGAAGVVSVSDTFQPGFVFLNATCTVSGVLTPNPCPSLVTPAANTSNLGSVALGSFNQQARPAYPDHHCGLLLTHSRDERE